MRLIYHFKPVPITDAEVQRLVDAELIHKCKHYECEAFPDTYHQLPGVTLMRINAELGRPAP